MFVQASIYNRSWLKPQLTKVLILIVLIVPLVAVKLEGNQEAAAVNVDLPSPQEEAAGSSNVMLSRRPPKMTQRVANKPSLPSNDLVFYSPLSPGKNVDWPPIANLEAEESLKTRVEKLKTLVYPRKREGYREQDKRWDLMKNLIQQNTTSSSVDTSDPALWQLFTMDMIQDGYLRDVSLVMQWNWRFFLHDRKDYAFSHAAVAISAKKTPPFDGENDLQPLRKIIWESDCNEWVLEDFAAKIVESCTYLQILKGSSDWQGYLDWLVKILNYQVGLCNKKYDSYKECIV